jgi:MoxR-like ATPase
VEERQRDAGSVAASLRAEVMRAVVGQSEVVDQVLATLIAGGHALLEGVPGVGKTLVVRALAQSFGGATNRVQFTPDLMPADVIGHVLYEARTAR